MKSGQKEFKTLKIAKLEKVNVLTEEIKKSLTLVTNEELAPVIYDRKKMFPIVKLFQGESSYPHTSWAFDPSLPPELEEHPPPWRRSQWTANLHLRL